ncbi:MAG: hypothetical protein U1E62_13130 [Alsobacter sp.]
MVVLLACLSLLLTLGGGAVAIYGADLIRLESGIALTTAGATVFCAGLLLAGLTAVLAELRRMRRLMEIDDNVAPPVAPPAPPPARSPDQPPPAEAVPEASPPPASEAAAEPLPKRVEPPAGSAIAPPPLAPQPPEAAAPSPLREAPLVADRSPLPPTPPAKPAAAVGSGIPAEARAGLVGYPGLSRLKPQDEARGRIEPVLDEVPAAPVVTAPKAERPVEPTLAPQAPPPSEVPASKGAPGPGPEEPASAAPPVAAKPEAPPPAGAPSADLPAGARTMLTSYTSGDVTYFMYSDGSIEADFPDGRRRFGSVDELRHYIEAGEGGEPVPKAASSA